MIVAIGDLSADGEFTPYHLPFPVTGGREGS
jgi:hypothetical protein